MYLESGRAEADSAMDPAEFVNSISQLMVYLIATGLISFWKTFEDGNCATENDLVTEYAQFWELFFNGIVFIPVVPTVLILNLPTVASSILAKALLDRLRSDHTHILLSLDGFSTFLCQADPVWITFAQKMIYHAHANTELILSGVTKNLPTTYEFLSLVWTVWFTVLGELDEPHVVDRLAETFTTRLDSLKQSDSQDSTGETKLAGFIADELSSISTKWGFPVSGVFYKNGEEEEDGKF
ncbi:hypothetical protein SprV_0501785700 [Sparganum proliferum]